MITTVSPTYSWEIRTYEGGFGLDGLLNVRQNDLRGILNGVDTNQWNPATDPLLPKNYTSGTVTPGKGACKKALQSAMGLEVRDDVPIVGMITRLVDQKGIAEVFAPTYGCLYRLCTSQNMQFVLLGSGEQWCVDEVNALQAKLPNFRARIGYSEPLSHLIEAGSDFFLMPSRYEPCGLNQMYSLLYGTLPIVRRTGGLADTVVQYDDTPAAKNGTGFLFDYLSPDAVYDTVTWALYTYRHKPAAFRAMQKRAMSQDFGWPRAAAAYAAVYKEALARIGVKKAI
jgi:starch synthase